MTHHLRWWLAPLVLAVGLAACRDTDDAAHGSTEPRGPAPTATTTDPAPASASARVPVEPPSLARPTVAPVTLPRAGLPLDDSAPAAGDSGTTTPAPSTGGRPPASPQPGTGIRIRGLDVHPIDVAEAEDGRGNRVPAVRPMALDVLADAWPGRALDPVLEVGDLRFRHYSHPGPGLLRYVAADADGLAEGAPVLLRWGEEDRHPTPIAPALQVPR